MVFKLVVVGLVIIMAISLPACSSPSPSNTNPAGISCDEFINQNHIIEQVEKNAGEFFTVTLGSNPTTGFQWNEEAKISDTGVVEQLQHEFIGPESEPPPPPGTPGQEVWTFRAQKEGTSTISMEYSRPWEGGEKGEWTYTLTITVK
ncbi:protease inhibitor I42 family protein [Chloroflexota bacterium]